MRRFAFLLAFGGVIAVAVVSAAAARSPRTTHDILPVAVSSAGSSTDLIFTSQKGQKRQRVSFAVFAQATRPGDSLPAQARQMLFSFPSSTITPQPDRARRLLAARNFAIYAAPTKQGGVCYLLLEPNGGSSSCVNALIHGALPQVTRGQVWGLMDNDANAVDVRVPGSGWRHAALGRNAFYLRLPKHVLAPTRIVVRERNGDRHIFDVKRCHVGKISPLSGLSPLPPPPC